MRTFALAVAVLVSATSLAAAQAPGQTLAFDPEIPAAPAPAMETVSYRSQILAADGLSVALMLAGPAMYDRAPELSGIGFTGYLIAAPLVHLAHGRAREAGESLLLRTALPLIGGLAGYKLGPNDVQCDAASGGGSASFGGCSSGGSIGGMLVGVLGGGVAAMVLDTTYLGKYERPVTPTWTAALQPTRGGMTFGVSGSF